MRLLLTEDEAGIVQFMKRGLEAEGYALDVAIDGKQGQTMGKVNEYDIIIMDYMLPEQDGIQTVRKLRSKEVHTPIIMLTVIDDQETIIEALDAGADDYLTKPFEFEELLARIRALLRRERAMKSNILEFADVRLDTVRHEAYRRGRLLDLSKKEYSLLEYFMRNPDIVLTRNMILEHVWDYAADPFTNTVDVHIRYLRTKLDIPFPTRLLRTVHGVGYKLEDPDNPKKY
ncbi:response regulator transcription factor [Patescibacteria group bacterium]